MQQKIVCTETVERMWFIISVIIMWILAWIKRINQLALRTRTTHYKKKQYDSVCVYVCEHRAITRKEGMIRRGIFNKKPDVGTRLRIFSFMLLLGTMWLWRRSCERDKSASHNKASGGPHRDDGSVTHTPKPPQDSTRGAALMSASARCVKFCIWRHRIERGSGI